MVLAAFLGGALCARAGRAEQADPYRPLAVFARVLGYVEKSYVEAIPFERLVRAAIHGVVAELDGPSTYLDAQAFSALKAEARPDFGGIGLELTRRGDRVVVAEVHPDTPAARGGVHAGDVVVRVDEDVVRSEPLTAVAERIMGVPGTSVVLGLDRGDGTGPFAVRLVRARIFRSSVTSARHGPFGYLRLARFDERAGRDILRGLEIVREGEPLAGLVLDLRGNPGGLLDQAVAISDLWLAQGPIVSTEGRDRGSEVQMAKQPGTEPRYPLAVLVDEGTASAAEIVSGALKDRGRGRLFGQRTFGKGSVQTLIELEDGSALKLTVARYLTPSGRSIDGAGIEPDEPVSKPQTGFRFGDRAKDPTLRAALTWLAGKTGRRLPTTDEGAL